MQLFAARCGEVVTCLAISNALQICLLYRCGADVVVTDIHSSLETKELISRLNDIGSRAMFLECDVRDRTAVDDVMKEVEK
jgi:NAD(P)-dependent dehydrogenase (short-subunit alcohol dehydrogenase family)